MRGSSSALRWGLILWFAKDIKIGFSTFNYRSEDFTSDATFKGAWERGRRCLVPCDGFFEFTGPKGEKQPWFIKPKDNRPMAFAGLWDSWRGPKDAPKDTPLAPPLVSFNIATCKPNATVAPIHDRMPVLFTREAEWDAWLKPESRWFRRTAESRTAHSMDYDGIGHPAIITGISRRTPRQAAVSRGIGA